MLDTPLVRLQCYEGIDAAEALYEWNYPRQLLGIRLAEAAGREVAEHDLFGPDYLVERPLLQAIRHPGPRPVVLLVDEVDRADDEFEAFLLEMLAEAAVTIPELGTLRASSAGRGAHVEPHPRPARRPQAPLPLPLDRLPRPRPGGRGHPPAGAGRLDHHRRAGGGGRARLRALDVQKPPGLAEAIDWVAALELLGLDRLDAAGRRGGRSGRC